MLGYHLVPNVFLFATFSSIFSSFLTSFAKMTRKMVTQIIVVPSKTLRQMSSMFKQHDLGTTVTWQLKKKKKHWELWWWNQCLLGSAWVGFSNLKAIHENCNFSRKICNLCILDMKPKNIWWNNDILVLTKRTMFNVTLMKWIVKLSKLCDTISRKIEKKSAFLKVAPFFADLKASCHICQLLGWARFNQC